MEREPLTPEEELDLFRSLRSTRPVSGFTHNFYRYPARMSPDFVREAMAQFTSANDVVLDPFLGGGTTVVEAVATGRRSIGVDLNPLSTFVTEAKTTPLSVNDVATLTRWADRTPSLNTMSSEVGAGLDDPRMKNLPPVLVRTFDRLLQYSLELPFPRQQRFARCALLRLGQWAVDCKSGIPNASQMQVQWQSIVIDMLNGLDLLVQSAAHHGVEKRRITSRRSILLRSSLGLEDSLDLAKVGRPKLVLTSPPYPAVHVLYHRWQVAGRRETPAPYWLIGSPDGRGATYFTMGSRSQFGIDNYFRTLTAVFRSVRAIIDESGLVVQLVSFSDAEHQLPAFLRAMEDAGFKEDELTSQSRDERWRTVPNRNWYYRVDATRGSARELLLIHRPV